MAKKTLNISVALAVFNEEKNLGRCLDSVSDFAGEIVIVDGGSTDASVSIATQYGAKVIKTDNPPIFHINKQKALDGCTMPWILQLDADEVITPELREEITTIITDNSKRENGYYIPRMNYFWGHFMAKGGQYPDYVIRLVKKGFASFPCKSVHEQIDVRGETGYLTNPMLHYSYMNRADYWKKAHAYTSLTASELKKTYPNLMPGVLLQTAFSYLFVKPIVTFLSLYVRHKGFIDGLTGFEFSLYSALHFPIAYGKFLAK